MGSGSSSGMRQVMKGNVLWMGVVSFWTDFATECIYPFLPIFLTALAGPEGLIYLGVMESLAESTSSFFKIVSGRISDLFRRRKLVVLVGYGISSLVRPTTGLAPWAWLVVLIRVVDRIGKGTRTSPRDALISDSVTEQQRGLAFSFHRMMDHLGAISGPFFAFAITYAYLGHGVWDSPAAESGTGPVSRDTLEALRVLFMTAWGPGLLAFLTIIFGVREIPPPADAVQQGQHATTSRGKPKPVFSWAAWKALPKEFYVYICIVFLFGVGNSSDLFLVLLGATRFEFSVLKILLMWIALHAAKVASSLPSGLLSDKIGRRPLIIAGWLLYALVYLGIAFSAQEWHYWGLVGLYGLYYGLTEGAERALVADFCPSTSRGSAFGLFHAAVGLSCVPSSLIFGVFWSVLGPKVAYCIGAGIAGLCTVLLFILDQAVLARRPRTAIDTQPDPEERKPLVASSGDVGGGDPDAVLARDYHSVNVA